jgi:ComF family protein
MLKFHNAEYAASTVAFFMAAAVSLQKVCFDAVIPIPLSEKRLRQRGYNQAQCLASPLAQTLNIPCLPEFLERFVHTAQQSRFSDPVRRKANVSGAFKISENADVSGLSILLVDDVMTTGATLHEAATALYRGGATFVMGVAAASGRFTKNEEAILRFTKNIDR